MAIMHTGYGPAIRAPRAAELHRIELHRYLRRPFPAQAWLSAHMPIPPVLAPSKPRPPAPAVPMPKPRPKPKPALPPTIRPAALEPLWQRPILWLCDLLDSFRYTRRSRHATDDFLL